jgi:hypothetical protein
MARATRAKRSTEKIDHAGRADASVAGLKRTFLEHLFYTQGRFIQGASLKDGDMALAFTVRDQLLHRWVKTVEKYMERGIKVVSYLSAEFLLVLQREFETDGIGMRGGQMFRESGRRVDHLGKRGRESIITFAPQFHDDSRRFPGRRNSGVWYQPCIAFNPNSD